MQASSGNPRSEFCLYDFAAPEGVARSALDPFDETFLADPVPGHRALREAGPIVWLDRYNVLAVARFEQVKAVLLDWHTFSSERGVGMEDFERHGRFRLPSVILECDPPEHDRARGVLTRALSPALLRRIKGDVEAKAEAVAAALVAAGEVDGVSEIAEAFPMAVFPDLVGIPDEGRGRLLAHADLLFNSFGPRNALFQASRAGAASEWVESLGTLENLTPDGLGAAIHREARDAGLDEVAGGMLVRALLQAGFDTTINALSAALYCLASNPGQWRLVRETPSLIGSALEEAIRLESPVQTFFRTVTCDVEFAGVRLHPGLKVLMFLAAANRDPAQFADADTYDVTRPPGTHLGFGSGIHRCVGRMLAKLEAEAILGSLARRAERIELAGSPVRRLNNTVRGFRTLPLRLHAA